MTQSSRDRIVKTARRICKDQDKKAAWTASWNHVINHLEPLFKKPGIKSFEVNHILVTAREAFLRSAVGGKALEDCEIDAIERVAIGTKNGEQP